MKLALGKGMLLWSSLQLGAFGHGTGIDWPHYLGDLARTHYSRLDQINRENVGHLQVAWTYRGGVVRPDERTQIQCNPIVVEGVLYATTAHQVLVALDAEKGSEYWRFDPRVQGRSVRSDPRHRGVALWGSRGNRRVLFAHDRFLYAVDAKTGQLIETFGDGGVVDFSRHLGREGENLPVGSGTPGVVFENLYVLATRTLEVGGAAPGHILAFDVRTGRRAWIFHTIPHPGEYGHDTWPTEAWKGAGGANCWAGMALDSERGLVYVPTGSASYDFWGGERLGQNLFANSLLCLDARTGRRKWHYQIVRHDIWDRDLPAPPTLHTVERDGIKIPAVAQTTKSGHVFVFHRETGEPLFPIIELSAPPSRLEGELASPAQPVPIKPAPFARQVVNYDTLSTLSPAGHRHALLRLAQLRASVPFQPPSVEGTIVAPGQDGGAEWGGAAVDPDGIMFVNGCDVPGILTMVDIPRRAGAKDNPGFSRYLQLCAGCHGIEGAGNSTQNIPAVTQLKGRFDRDQLMALLMTGRGQMPSFSFLSVTERDELLDHLISGFGRNLSDELSVSERRYRPTVSSGSPYGHVFEQWTDDSGYPAVKPPWGTLNAIDLNTGEYQWTVPLGEYPELTARGVPITGTGNYGGPVVTAGGLVFIAATPDRKFRAFDRRTGKLLWQYELPAAGFATPATYAVHGRQYVVVACGGGKLKSPPDDLYLAFALPPERPH